MRQTLTLVGGGNIRRFDFFARQSGFTLRQEFFMAGRGLHDRRIQHSAGLYFACSATREPSVPLLLRGHASDFHLERQFRPTICSRAGGFPSSVGRFIGLAAFKPVRYTPELILLNSGSGIKTQRFIRVIMKDGPAGESVCNFIVSIFAAAVSKNEGRVIECILQV